MHVKPFLFGVGALVEVERVLPQDGTHGVDELLHDEGFLAETLPRGPHVTTGAVSMTGDGHLFCNASRSKLKNGWACAAVPALSG